MDRLTPIPFQCHFLTDITTQGKDNICLVTSDKKLATRETEACVMNSPRVQRWGWTQIHVWGS